MSYTNKLLIDDTDVYDVYKVILGESSFKSLLQYPPYKASSVTKVEWAEYDNIDVDLSSFTLASRKVQLNLVFSEISSSLGGIEAKLRDFIDEFLDGHYHVWQFVDLGLILMLRFESSSNPKFFVPVDNQWGSTIISRSKSMTLSVTLSDDFPSNFRLIDAPISEYLEDYGRKRSIDPYTSLTLYPGTEYEASFHLWEFGAFLLEGSTDSIFMPGPIKSSLSRDLNFKDGLDFIDSLSTHKGKTLKLSLLFTASSWVYLFTNYRAFFKQITFKTPVRWSLKHQSTTKIFDAYYNSASVKEFNNLSVSWLKVDLTFQIIEEIQ